MAARQEVHIPLAGEQLATYLYRPSTPRGDLPCVVMAHGFSATRDDGLPAYAEAFRDAGFAVALFDYRHFGASTGEPRQLLDIGRQHDDYRAVVSWVRRLGGIDPDRIVLWGSSFSGGHVLAVAARDSRIAAVISQAPFTDAIPTLMHAPLKNAVRLTAAGLWDQWCGWRGRPPRLAAAVGAPGTVAAMTAADAKPGFEAMVGPNSLWRNEFATRLMLRIPFYRPGRKTPRLAMPLLICVCENDTRPRPSQPSRPPPGRRAASCAATPTAISTSTTIRRSKPTRSTSWSEWSPGCPPNPNAGRLAAARPIVRLSRLIGARVHEMAITQSVVDAVCEHAAGRRVHSVKLEIGALCAVVPDSMQFCFELATEGTVADGARLDLDVQPGAARCRTCANEFEMRDLILLCPCGSADVEVLAGRDLKILSMEVS